MKVSWIEHRTNEEVLQLVETERQITDTLRSRQKRWIGHILKKKKKNLLTSTMQYALAKENHITVVAGCRKGQHHQVRHDSLLKTTLEGQIQRKKGCGRRRTNVLGLVTEDGGSWRQ